MRKACFCACLPVLALLTCSGVFAQSTSIKRVNFVGTTKLKASKTSGTPLNKIVQGPDADVSFDIPGISGNNSPARLPANFVPRPAGNAIGSGSTLQSFTGLDQFLQAIAATGVANTANGQLEPPDQRRIRKRVPGMWQRNIRSHF